MSKRDQLIAEYRKAQKMNDKERMASLLEMTKKGVIRAMMPKKYDEDVAGLPKYKETEDRIATRPNASDTLMEELKHMPENFGQGALKLPVTALKALSVPYQRVESAIANPLMELQKADERDLPKRMLDAFVKGATGERRGELGDIPRRAGFGEAPSKFIGFGAALGSAFPAVNKAIGKTFKLLPKVKPLTKSQDTVKHLIRKRWGDIALGNIKSGTFTKKIRDVLTKEERSLVPFMIEKKFTKEALATIKKPEVRARLKTHIKPVVKEVKQYFDDAHKDLSKIYGSNIGHWENYVSHFWDIPKSEINAVAKRFATSNPTMKKRSIMSLKEGIEGVKNSKGEIVKYKPLTTDISEILSKYDSLRYTTVANQKLITTLAKLKLIKTQGAKGTDGWKAIDHPAFARNKLTVGKYLKDGEKNLTKGLVLGKRPAVVDPEIHKIVTDLLDKPFDAGWIHKVEGVNALAKRLNLSLSLFHHVALTETAIANVGLRKTAKVVMDSLKGKQYVFTKPRATQELVKAGGSIAVPTDAVQGKFYGMLKNAENSVNNPLLKGSIKGVTNLSKKWDAGLWDYLHNNFKVMAYESMRAKVLTNPKRYGVDKAPLSKIKAEIAQFTNDVYGGQAWELLGKSKKWQQSMHWAMLSPDWTYSTIRQALSPTGAFHVYKDTIGLRKQLGTDFWRNAGLYFWGGMNATNYATSKRLTGEGRFMWDNPPGKKTSLFIGYEKDNKGIEREQYLRWGKQFRELPEFFLDPIGKFGGKLSPVVRESLAQLTKHHVGGYPTSFAQMPFKESVPGRVSHAAAMFVPYSTANLLRSKGEKITPGKVAVSGAFPISKGMTAYKARELFMKSIQSSDMPLAKEIWDSSLRNNVDPYTAFRNARNILQQESRYKDKLKLEKSISSGEKLKDLTPRQRKTLKRLMSSRKALKKLRRKFNQ